jgi:hypothetical protein
MKQAGFVAPGGPLHAYASLAVAAVGGYGWTVTETTRDAVTLCLAIVAVALLLRVARSIDHAHHRLTVGIGVEALELRADLGLPRKAEEPDLETARRRVRIAQDAADLRHLGAMAAETCVWLVAFAGFAWSLFAG